MPDQNLKTIKITNADQVQKETYNWGQMRWIANKDLSDSTELTAGLTTLPPGSKNSMHRHPNCEEVLYVLSGEIDHVIEGTVPVRLPAGSCIVVPKNKKHQAHNVGSTPAELFVAFSSAERQIIVEE